MKIEVVQFVIPRRDRSHNGIVNPRLPELFRKYTLPFLEEEAVAVQNIAADILLNRKSVVKLVPEPGNPPLKWRKPPRILRCGS